MAQPEPLPQTFSKHEELMIQEAAEKGDLNALRELHNRNQAEFIKSWRERCAMAAISHGHLEVLRWLYANGLELHPWACEMAACGGHIETLQWLRGNGCPWGEAVCSYAAEFGRTATLEWLHRNGCPWNEDTCEEAAAGGHLETLQWAVANGCPWDKPICAGVARDSGHVLVAGWIEAQN